MSFDVKESRMGERMTFTSTGSNNESISVTWHKEYDIEWLGSAPQNVSTIDVLQAPGIPKVNRSIFSTATTIMPYVICRDKTAERNPDRISRWKVRTKWATANKRGNAGGASSSEESDNLPISIPASVEDIPSAEYVSLGETERVLWFEKGDFPLYQTSRTPSGNFWNEPVMERMPVFELKITQYEEGITYEDMIDRKFKVNKKSYRNKLPLSWLIEQVEAQEVEVLTTNGPTLSALVTYTLLLSPDEEYGWQDVRGLFDSQFLTVANDFDSAKQFQNLQPGTQSIGYIKLDGTKRADQTGEPDYIPYEIYDTIDFDSFLRS